MVDGEWYGPRPEGLESKGSVVEQSRAHRGGAQMIIAMTISMPAQSAFIAVDEQARK